ncbi:MAG: phosphodiester glycosidase family protein [Bacteroidota bacterium]|nr:phosphodiester glycosidase family protein [Bacteroidota bacterium]
MKKYLYLLWVTMICFGANAQLSWKNLDSLYQPLPASVHIYKSTDSIGGKPDVVYYVIANLKDKHLKFTTDTTYKRRLTPSQFFEKDNHPLLVVNGTFFSFATNQNLNIVEKNGKLVGYNVHTIAAKGEDTLTWYHTFDGAFGISKNRTPDVAWLYTDSSKKYPYASEHTLRYLQDSISNPSFDYLQLHTSLVAGEGGGLIPAFKKWKMKTAIGGGPVLVQNNKVQISNNEEKNFSGKAINDRHPRTAIGYTNDNKIIILVAEGRSESASGLTLTQEAQILADLGCEEALNLDGGGSTCMLLNGKQTNSPSDKEGQRTVPSVFLIEKN